jgi:radical SAM superfamily enzyme YgiQ (UPF0313 family)
VPIVLGGIEGSLRRIAHYDYWSDKVRRSIVVDAKCDLLLYGNAERALVEVAHRLAAREPVEQITDVRGTAFVRARRRPKGWFEIDSTSVDSPAAWKPHQPLPDHQRAGAGRAPAARAQAKDTISIADSADGRALRPKRMPKKPTAIAAAELRAQPGAARQAQGAAARAHA